nr:MAG TPA: Morphogenesis protein 1 wall, phi29, hydrolase, infection [Caudoviricetes sp.]
MSELQDKKQLNKRIQQIEEKEAKRVEKNIARREKRFAKMLDSQMTMLESFYSTSNKVAKGMLRDSMDGQQAILEDSLADMKREFNLYAKYMDNTTRKYYKGMISVADESLTTMKETVSKRFGEISDEFDEEMVGMTSSFTDRIKRFSKGIRDAAVALELTDMADSVKSSLTDITDSFIDNFRERSAKLNGNITKSDYQRMIGNVVDSSYSMGRNEASELVNGIMDEMGMKTAKQLDPYLKEVASLHTAIDANISDLSSIIKMDINSGGKGEILKEMSNIATGLGSDKDLTVDSNAMLSSMNEHIEDLYGLSKKDSVKFKGMTKSLAIMEGIQQQQYNKGVEEAGGKIVEWSKMSVPELQKDDDFLNFMARSGMSAEEFRKAIDTGHSDEVMKSMQQLFIANKDDAYALNQLRESMGFSSDAVAQMFADADSLTGDLKKVTDNINKNSNLSGSNAESMAGYASGPIEKIGNWLSDSFPVRMVSDFFGELDIKAANMANYAIIAYTISDRWGDVKDMLKMVSSPFKSFGKFLKGGGFKTLFSSKGALSQGIESGLRTLFTGKGSFISTIVGKFKSVFSWIGKVFYANAPDMMIKAFSKVGSKLGGVFSSFFGKIFDKIGSTGIGKLASKLFSGGIFKVLGKVIPIVGGFFDVILDFFDGIGKADEWFGKDHSLLQTITGGIIGAIFGTGRGVQGEDLMGDIFTILGGALKGGAAGFVVGGPVGALAGAIIGAIANAIGGDRVASAFKSLTDYISSIPDRIVGVFTSAFNAVHDLIADSWVGSLLGMSKNNPSASMGDNTNTLMKTVAMATPFGVVSNLLGSFGSHAGGLSEVPYDNYPAFLHKGEAVLTSQQAGAVRSDGGIPITGGNSLIEALGIDGQVGQGRSVLERVFRGVFGITGQDTYGEGGLFGNIFKHLLNLGTGGVLGNLIGGSGSIFDKLKEFLKGGGSSSSGSSSGGGKPANMSTGSGDGKKIWDFLAKAGYSAEGIAGILGNLHEESGFRSGAIQDDGGTTNEDLVKQITSSKDAFLADWRGFGLAQWTDKGRKSALWDFAQSKGTSVADFQTQLEFLLKELQEGYRGTSDALKGQISVDKASEIFGREYEGFGADSAASRLEKSKKFYEENTKGTPQYAQGTPWVPDTQVALIHEGEMVVPSDKNPLNSNNTSNAVGLPTDNSGSDDIVDAIKWQVSRLESKLDALINVVASSNSNYRGNGFGSDSSVNNLLKV